MPVLYVDGPMTHMPENYPAEETRRSVANLLRVVRGTRGRTLIVDHHALRDRAWRAPEPRTPARRVRDLRATTADAADTGRGSRARPRTTRRRGRTRPRGRAGRGTGSAGPGGWWSRG